jgi:hypothetical protein
MDYIGRDQIATLMQQYDNLIVMPLLKVIVGLLNPSQTKSPNLPTHEQPSTSFGLFGSITSIQ